MATPTITWYDIKLRTLQKMFATTNGSTVIPTDPATQDYISAMPGAANEALQMLATAGKFIIKTIDIAHIPLKSLLSTTQARIQSVESGTISFSADGARSMYFEIKGKGTMTVQIGEEEPTETEFDSSVNAQLGYEPMRLLFENEDKEKVFVSFESDYPMSVKNAAMYSATFDSADDVPPYSEYVRYNLSELVDDFYMVDPEEVIYEGDAETITYTATSDFFQEGFKVLVLPRDMKGNYKIHYKAYPPVITLATEDETELALDPEVAALLPLYMASQLYKDDDIGVATTYRNEFEVAFERLVKNVKAPSAEHFASTSGWI